MQKIIFSLLILGFLCVNVSLAQSKVKERDLKGTWKLVIDIDESEGDAAIERAVLGAVDGFISSFDITFQFKRDNELKVVVNVFGEEEVEYSNWKIQDGYLYLGDNNKFDMDDTLWYLEGDRLIAEDINDDSGNHSVYLERIY